MMIKDQARVTLSMTDMHCYWMSLPVLFLVHLTDTVLSRATAAGSLLELVRKEESHEQGLTVLCLWSCVKLRLDLAQTHVTSERAAVTAILQKMCGYVESLTLFHGATQQLTRLPYEPSFA